MFIVPFESNFSSSVYPYIVILKEIHDMAAIILWHTLFDYMQFFVFAPNINISDSPYFGVAFFVLINLDTIVV